MNRHLGRLPPHKKSRQRGTGGNRIAAAIAFILPASLLPFWIPVNLGGVS